MPVAIRYCFMIDSFSWVALTLQHFDLANAQTEQNLAARENSQTNRSRGFLHILNAKAQRDVSRKVIVSVTGRKPNCEGCSKYDEVEVSSVDSSFKKYSGKGRTRRKVLLW